MGPPLRKMMDDFDNFLTHHQTTFFNKKASYHSQRLGLCTKMPHCFFYSHSFFLFYCYKNML